MKLNSLSRNYPKRQKKSLLVKWENYERKSQLHKRGWKDCVHILHGKVIDCFKAISAKEEYPLQFSEGKPTLIPKPGEFSSQKQTSITCLSTLYKWFTACLMGPLNDHLTAYNLMERHQRGAKSECKGTMDNLLVDRMALQDCVQGRRNICMAWIDEKKVYDSEDHDWLCNAMKPRTFLRCNGSVTL